jgi:hypothetical protein
MYRRIILNLRELDVPSGESPSLSANLVKKVLIFRAS